MDRARRRAAGPFRQGLLPLRVGYGPDLNVKMLKFAQGGASLAGRTVMQAMLGKVVRVAKLVADRADLHGDGEERYRWRSLRHLPDD